MDLKFEDASKMSDPEWDLFNFIISNTWQIPSDRTECVTCQVDEEDARPWDRYLLPCGHKFVHTRCFRKYCQTVGSFKCPVCGDLKKIGKTNKLKEQLLAENLNCSEVVECK